MTSIRQAQIKVAFCKIIGLYLTTTTTKKGSFVKDQGQVTAPDQRKPKKFRETTYIWTEIFHLNWRESTRGKILTIW